MSSPDLSIKLRDNSFRTYQFPPRKSTWNRQTSLNPNVEKYLIPRHQSHPRVLTMYLLDGLPPPQWISLQLLRPIHGNPRWGHSCLLISGLGLSSSHKQKIMMRTGPHNHQHQSPKSSPCYHLVITWSTAFPFLPSLTPHSYDASSISSVTALCRNPLFDSIIEVTIDLKL